MSSILRQNNSCSSPILPDTFVSDQSEVASRIPHPHTNSGGATINTGELPTIMRGLAATHLGTNMLRTPGYQAIGNKGTNNGIQQQQSSTKSENPLKRISRYFKGNSKDKHNITVSSHPVSPPPSSFKFDHNIDTAVARESITPVSLDSSSPVLTMEESGIIDTLVASSVQKDNKPNSIRLDIFSSNLVLNTATNVLPTLHTRINNTVQLVYCCRVLSNSNRPSIASPITENSQEMILTDKEQDWAESMDPVAQNHYHWLVNQLVKMFAEDQLKDQDAIAEIVLVGSILDKSTCRSLLSCFITELENTTLLDLNILQGLIQLVECASDDYLADDDLVRIVTTLFSNLSLTHIGFSNHHLYLTWALCRILDIMVAGKVKDLNRDRDHQPLIQILTSLKDSDNVYLRHQATYAYQALQYLPDDETPLQIIWRYAQGAAQIASAATSILKIDPKGLLEGITALSQMYGDISNVFSASVEGVKAIGDATKTLRAGSGTAIRITEDISENIKKRSWYLTLQGTAMFIRQGRFSDFNIVVSQAPCRNNTNFQWGICRQLGEVAVDPALDNLVRRQAINFLEELYRGSADVRPHEDVKRWILTILDQISRLPDEHLRDYALSKLAIIKENDVSYLDGSFPLNTRLIYPKSFPLLAKVQEIPKVEHNLHALRSQRMTEYIQPVYIPPMAKPNLHASDDTLFPLLDRVRDFLESDCQVLLILGDSGAGKSTFNRYLEYELWKEYTPGGRIPLFINLPALKEPENELIQEQLQTHDFSNRQIQELLQHRQITLICDGYDESQLNCNLHTSNLFNQSGQRDTKLIITCRSQYLGPDYRDLFVPIAINQYNRAASHLFQECVISSFTRSQIEDYVEQYVPLEPRTWVKKDYMDKLENIPNLMDLVQNPFLLTLCLEALPIVVQNEADLSRLRVTRIKLFDSFVQHWLDVNKRRLYAHVLKLKEASQVAFKMLLEDGFERNGTIFQMELASAIFQEQDGRPIVDYSHRKDKDTWKAKFFGPDLERDLLRESSLLNRAGNQYRFVHRSVLEYFYSCAIFESISKEDKFDLHNISFIESRPLLTRNLVAEPSVIQFLAERLIQDSTFKQHLFTIIEMSKHEEQVTQAAANAITILVKAGVQFNGQDLRGIRIPRADLRGGQFDSAQLQGADLTGVNFSKSWIRQADFTNAQMADVHFGELPYLKFEKQISSCAYSRDGKTLAIGYFSGEIATYDTISWARISTFEGHSERVSSIVFSPSGNQLLSGSEDMTVRIWNCESSLADFVLEEHANSVNCVAISPCGKQAASASEDMTVRLWDVGSGTCETIISDHTASVFGIAYSPDGKYILSVGSESVIRVFDAQTGLVKLVMECQAGPIYSISYSSDGSRIISGFSNGELQLWDSSSGRYLQNWKCHEDAINRVTVSPNGQWIATCSSDGVVKLWSTQSGRLITPLNGHLGGVEDIIFSPNGLILASGSRDRTVRLWDLSTIDIDSTKESHSGRAHGAYSRDGQSVISLNASGVLRQYKTCTGELERTITYKYANAKLVVISPDGRRVATVEYFGSQVHIWSTESGKKEFVITGHKKSVRAVAFSRCGHMITTGGDDMTIHVWDAESGLQRQIFSSHTKRVLSLQFSPNSEQIVSVNHDGDIIIWDIDTSIGRKLCVGRDTKHSFTAVGFSPINLQITASDLDNHTITIWNPTNGGLQHTLKHDKPVNDFVWSYCEQWIATRCLNSVWFWNRSPNNSTEWTCAVIIRDFHGYVCSICWKPDSLEFIIGCSDGSVRVWKLVEKMGVWSAQLVWGTGISVFVATGAVISNVIGLGTVNRQLLDQRANEAVELMLPVWPVSWM